jgi:hypothetical protein
MAELARHGLQVTGPCSSAPVQGEPDTAYIGVSDLASGRYAEVSLVRHTPDPGTWYLQLSYWTDASQDPAGQDMASRVRRLLSGPGGQAPVPAAGGQLPPLTAQAPVAS